MTGRSSFSLPFGSPTIRTTKSRPSPSSSSPFLVSKLKLPESIASICSCSTHGRVRSLWVTCCTFKCFLNWSTPKWLVYMYKGKTWKNHEKNLRICSMGHTSCWDPGSAETLLLSEDVEVAFGVFELLVHICNHLRICITIDKCKGSNFHIKGAKIFNSAFWSFSIHCWLHRWNVKDFKSPWAAMRECKSCSGTWARAKWPSMPNQMFQWGFPSMGVPHSWMVYSGKSR